MIYILSYFSPQTSLVPENQFLLYNFQFLFLIFQKFSQPISGANQYNFDLNLFFLDKIINKINTKLTELLMMSIPDPGLDTT